MILQISPIESFLEKRKKKGLFIKIKGSSKLAEKTSGLASGSGEIESGSSCH